MSLGISLALASAGALSAGPAIVTGSVMTRLLNRYYSNSGWTGDRSSIYPQFTPSAIDGSNGKFYGNTGKVHEFIWQSADFFFGFIDIGYTSIAIKVPLLNWTPSSGPIHLHGQFKVHDAFDKPWVTLFSKKVTHSDAH